LLSKDAIALSRARRSADGGLTVVVYDVFLNVLASSRLGNWPCRDEVTRSDAREANVCENDSGLTLLAAQTTLARQLWDVLRALFAADQTLAHF
jgi:hypothetical protein